MPVLTGDVGQGRIDGSRRVHTSRSAMVAISLEGIVLPRQLDRAVIPLDLASVELLARLSRGPEVAAVAADAVATRFGLTPEAVLGLITPLLASGALVEDDGSDGDVPSVAPPDPTPVELPAPGPTGTDGLEVLAVPTVFRIHDGRFEHRRHDGRLVLSLDVAEMAAASAWREPCTADAAHSRFVAEHPSSPLDPASFDALSARLRSAGLLAPYESDQDDNGNGQATAYEQREEIRRSMRILNATKVAVERNAAEQAQLPDGGDRVPVIPIHDNWVIPPLPLGMIVAYAKAYRDGALQRSYDFVPRWLIRPAQISEVCDRPGIFLFSNYIWSYATNLDTCARIKSISPTSITIHGGPDTPKYEGDVERFFHDNPHVDVAVRGEGEATFAAALEALVGRVGDGPVDLTPLGDVAGLSFRLGDRIVTTPDRDRIADLDTIPSPYLTGLFDSFIAGPAHCTKIETNRGCPYGCTFCDWGSATNSRIRKFDLDRVFAEIEWSAQHGFDVISLCDANFGIFERDVAIAEKIAEVKQKYGFPLSVGNNYAKNTVKHLKEIIRILADVEILAEGTISLQSMDTDTLEVIRRKNIKVEKYTDLAAQFTANRLPLAVDLMIGLPGSTVESFTKDLQACANRDVRIRAHPTQLLTNSPMNDPAYRAEHGIVALPGEVVKRTNTFDEDDWQYMWELRNVFLLCDLFAVLRQVARYVRSETGLQEVAFYDRFLRDAVAEPERWPTVAFTFRTMSEIMVPPCSWRLFIDEVGDYLTSVLGVPDDDALETVLAAQLLHLPARDRQFPETVDTAHDIIAWHRARVAACEAGHFDDWEDHVPPLRSFGPGALTVDDPEQVCESAIGGTMLMFGVRLLAWDLESEIARPRNAHRYETEAVIEGEVVLDQGERGEATPVELVARSGSGDPSLAR